MKKYLVVLLFLQNSVFSQEEKKELRKPIEPKHSNIHIQKISNKSSRNIFIAFERTHIMPLMEPIELAGHIIPGKSFEIIDPEGIHEAVMVPVWQDTFRGNTINIVSLAGNPGRIYYLYVINGHLWAIKAPSKHGELKGVHLLNPSEKDRDIEIEVYDHNVLKVHVLDQNGKQNGESTQLKYEPQAYIAEEQQEKRYAK